MMTELDPADRARIEELLSIYTIALNNNDWAAYEQVFTSDAVVEFTADSRGTMLSPIRGLASIVDQVASSSDFAAGRSDHHSVTCVIRRDGQGIVRAWSHFITARPDGFASRGEYLDIIVQTGSGWRISHRRGNVRTKYGAQPRQWYGAFWLSGDAAD
jgi:hypothetical protein